VGICNPRCPTYMTGMRDRKRPRMKLDELLTDVFAGLVIAALIAGIISQIHV